MQENEVGLEQLKNVYKAQTEAYLDFNMALINILTNQKELLVKVESLKILISSSNSINILHALS